MANALLTLTKVKGGVRTPIAITIADIENVSQAGNFTFIRTEVPIEGETYHYVSETIDEIESRIQAFLSSV